MIKLKYLILFQNLKALMVSFFMFASEGMLHFILLCWFSSKSFIHTLLLFELSYGSYFNLHEASMSIKIDFSITIDAMYFKFLTFIYSFLEAGAL